jgi:glycerol-3-phosphate dehydrogenase (NAD(P)+)
LKIGIIGLGNFGTALAQHFSKHAEKQKLEVLAWSRDTEVVDRINQEHFNPKYLSDFKLDIRFKATTKLSDLADSDYIFLMLPASTLPEIFKDLPRNSSTKFVSCMKGLCANNLTPLQFLSQQDSFKNETLVLSGPGFAKDLIAGKPISVVIAGKELLAKEFANNFSIANLRFYHATDTLGVELGGILKNVIAIAAGVADGLGLGDSTRAGLVTRGLHEMMKIGSALGAEKQTFFGLSGLGDLVLTATCDTSRNRQVGLRLSKNWTSASGQKAGESLDTILNEIASVAEGVKSAKKVLDLALAAGIEAPITKVVNDLLELKLSPNEAVDRLLARSIKAEF